MSLHEDAAPREDRRAPVRAAPGPPWRGTGVVLASGLAVAAWAVLVVWNAGPQAGYLSHDGLAGSGLGTLPTIGVFVAGWVLMIAGMMVPTTLPLVALFGAVVRDRPNRRRLVAAVLCGYLAIWTAVGYLALAGDTVLHRVEDVLGGPEPDSPLVLAAVLGVAGAFQLSPLKYRCLDACRSPRAVVMTHWRGRRPIAESVELGWRHGRSCVGCCWALMLVMFAVGHGHLGWMLALGAVMTAEKVAPFGRWLASVAGVALLAASALLATGLVT